LRKQHTTCCFEKNCEASRRKRDATKYGIAIVSVLNKKTFIPIKPKNPIGRPQKVLQMTLLVLATTSNAPCEQP
jgi:hypothetical protein